MAQSQQQPQRRHPIFNVLAYGHGHQLAKRELTALERLLVRAGQADWDALRPAMDMYLTGQLTLAGYALLLWERLEAHNADVYAYHEHISRTPVVWDGLQQLELVQWNLIAADRWTCWAKDGHGSNNDHGAEGEAQS